MKIKPPEFIPEGINPILFESFHVFCMAEWWMSYHSRTETMDVHQVFWKGEPHWIRTCP